MKRGWLRFGKPPRSKGGDRIKGARDADFLAWIWTQP